MKEQNFKNHSRVSIPYHGVTWLAILALLIGSVVNLVNSTEENLYSASLITLIALILCSLSWYARKFALVAQDRAIRAEESLRHYILTGKPIDHRLTLSQIISLRFASDEELQALAREAADKNLTAGTIKKKIRNWRADHHRV